MRWKTSSKVACLSCLLLVQLGCRSRPKPKQDFPAEVVPNTELAPEELPPEQAKGGAGAANAKGAPPSLCQLGTGSGFMLGEPGRTSADADDAVELPFGVDLGGVMSAYGGFAVGALVPVGKSLEAQVVWVPAAANRGISVALGSVHGGGPAPELALNSEVLLVAIPDTDAAGKTLRLASVSAANLKPVVHFGEELAVGRDDSDAFSLASVHNQTLLVWDDFDKKAKPKGHSVIRGISFSPTTIDKPGQPFLISPPFLDAQAPRLVARGDAFWLVWAASEGIEKAPPRAIPSDENSATPEETHLVDAERRYLQVVLLDGAGKPLGKPLNISEPSGQVLAYDCSVDAAGALIVAFRNEAAPGVERETIEVVRVLPDGSVRRRSLPGAWEPGAPDLLLDSGRKPALLQLLVGDEAGGARLSEALTEDVNPAFSNEPALARSRVLGINQGRVLLAQPRGRALQLRSATCGAAQKSEMAK